MALGSMVPMISESPAIENFGKSLSHRLLVSYQFVNIARRLKIVHHFRLLFAYPGDVFNIPSTRRCDYTIRCKGCRENIPAPVQTLPDTWIIAECPLCHEKRRYLPSEVFRGNLSARLNTSTVAGSRHV